MIVIGDSNSPRRSLPPRKAGSVLEMTISDDEDKVLKAVLKRSLDEYQKAAAAPKRAPRPSARAEQKTNVIVCAGPLPDLPTEEEAAGLRAFTEEDEALNSVYLFAMQAYLESRFRRAPSALIAQAVRTRSLFGAWEHLCDLPAKERDTNKHPRSGSGELVLTGVEKIVPGPLKARLVRSKLAIERNAEMLASWLRKQKELDDLGDRGLLLHCGVCFSPTPHENLAQCPDGHVFCLTCCKRHAEVLMGMNRHRIVCPDTSGCKEEFSQRQLMRFMSASMLKSLDERRAAEEVTKAEIPGLLACPKCPFMAMDADPSNPQPVLRCEVCSFESCTKCHLEAHPSMDCEAYRKTKVSTAEDFRKAIENQMAESLIRTCPKCKNRFIKSDEGCNKVACPNSACKFVVCWVCNAVVNPTKPYDHFRDASDRRPEHAHKCVLYVSVAEQRRIEEKRVMEGGKRARAEFEASHVITDEMKELVGKTALDEPMALPPVKKSRKGSQKS